MPIVIVVDASVLAPALCDDGTAGQVARQRLGDERLAAPELIYPETASVLRGLVRGGRLSVDRAALALTDLVDLPIECAGQRTLVGRCWELRENLTMYDAAYVVLAELLGVPLVTADARLARAAGDACTVEVLS